MPRRDNQWKEGHGKPEGVRLTMRKDSEGANPKDGARVKKTWQVTAVGVKRSEMDAKHATSKGRRLNKPLSTESTRTLDGEKNRCRYDHRRDKNLRKGRRLAIKTLHKVVRNKQPECTQVYSWRGDRNRK